MVTKSKDCSDIHELCLSQAEFERREKNKQAIYGGAILNRRVRADNMKCFPYSLKYGAVYIRSRSDAVLSCFALVTSSSPVLQLLVPETIFLNQNLRKRY